MRFYFIAMTPYLEKALGGVGDVSLIYLAFEDAQKELDFVNNFLPPYTWRIFQAEAVNIYEIKEFKNDETRNHGEPG